MQYIDVSNKLPTSSSSSKRISVCSQMQKNGEVTARHTHAMSVETQSVMYTMSRHCSSRPQKSESE